MKKIKQQNMEATILTIFGGIGLIVTSILVAKETPKALKLLEDSEKEKEEPLTIPEKIITAFPAYVPAVAFGTSTLLCIFGANVLNKKAQASLMSAYTITGNLYRDYRKKNVEMFGEENDKAIIDELQRCNGSYHQIGINTPDAKVRWHEPISDTFFEAYEREVMDAEYHINRNFVLRGCTWINEMLTFFGIALIDDGDENGWCVDEDFYWLDFSHHLKEDSKGPYYEIHLPFEPEDLGEYKYY